MLFFVLAKLAQSFGDFVVQVIEFGRVDSESIAPLLLYPLKGF